MSSNYKDIDGTVYSINLEKFMEFVYSITPDEKDSTTNITQIFAVESELGESVTSEIHNENISDLSQLKPVSKEIEENKANNNTAFNNIRYDLLRILLNIVINPYYNPDGSLIVNDEMFLGQKIAFNTLLNNGILVELGNK